MCGIAGVLRFDGLPINTNDLKEAVQVLNKRGPDAKGIFSDRIIGLCHTRLAIIDPEPASNQPFHDTTDRYVLVYNGEIFNFKQLRNDLEKQGVLFHTKSDTEVLMQLLIREGEGCLTKLNGFFAFAFYDKQQRELLLARDRFGVKPLYVYQDGDRFVFASEMKAMIALGIPRKLDYESLLFYFQLNYIPSPFSVFEGVEKLPQAHWLKWEGGSVWKSSCYYRLKDTGSEFSQSFKNKETLKELLSKAVADRMVSDVPLGVFLSGGVDSSIVALLSQGYKRDIHSFSIGFKDNRFFDESSYAEKVAKHLGTKHHTFYLSNEEMLGQMDEMLAYLDEPFADSSAIAVYHLCKETRKHVTVALTGDGADEVFGGYNKHLAEWKIRKKGFVNSALATAAPLLTYLPESRGGLWGNEARKLKKYANSISLSPEERYWNWCSFSSEKQAMKLFSAQTLSKFDKPKFEKRKADKLVHFTQSSSFNAVLRSDVDMVLEGDMLVKTDRMSMANGVELRNPFLDHRVVDFAFGLHPDAKVSQNTAKRVLKESFKPYLPFEVFARPKHGFEVPLESWFKNELKDRVQNDWLNDSFVKEQGFFDPAQIKLIKQQLFSSNVSDVPQRVWGLVVFQQWWKNYMGGE
jgi:asparagine synthase (glutamine-hydrolysing)